MPKSVYTEAYRAVIAWMRAARISANVSQEELARRLGKPQQFVSRVEHGIRRVDLVEFCAIIKALGEDPAEVLTALVLTFPENLTI